MKNKLYGFKDIAFKLKNFITMDKSKIAFFVDKYIVCSFIILCKKKSKNIIFF